jgi:hypothetical protein
LVNKFEIVTSNKDIFENSFFAAEFDSRGFEEIISHIAKGLIDPKCGSEFNINEADVDEFDNIGN